MFCLRSWLPLLFIPTSASPAFIVMFLISTYLFHRPCPYCSVIMLILFTSSCQWSDRCFLDTNNGHWFEPRILSHASVSSTSSTIAPGPGLQLSMGDLETQVGQWTGLGLEWLRSFLGSREWRVPCVDVTVRL
ncbi:hypothetical protein TWF506_001395 [Arthrobotrys conoides]|uniref:Bladder cancer-related BC10-like protein n=1 Tax=Arthrobotrys conoides TaxID=74498 RepID=A0AAN8NYD9_9PEZI